jgi:hypothetical protein
MNPLKLITKSIDAACDIMHPIQHPVIQRPKVLLDHQGQKANRGFVLVPFDLHALFCHVPGRRESAAVAKIRRCSHEQTYAPACVSNLDVFSHAHDMRNVLFAVRKSGRKRVGK